MTINYKNYSILQEKLAECITEKKLSQIKTQVDNIIWYCDLLRTNREVYFRQNIDFLVKEYLFDSVESFKNVINTEKEHIITSVKFDLNPVSDLLNGKLPQFNIIKIFEILYDLHAEITNLFISNIDKIANELIEKYINANKQFTFTCSNYLASATPANMVTFYNSKNDVLASISNDGVFTFKADSNDQNTKDFLKCVETLGIKITGIEIT